MGRQRALISGILSAAITYFAGVRGVLFLVVTVVNTFLITILLAMLVHRLSGFHLEPANRVDARRMGEYND
jgi:hypothetical protein